MKLKPEDGPKIARLRTAISAGYERDMTALKAANAAISDIELSLLDLRKLNAELSVSAGTDLLNTKVATQYRRWLEANIKDLNMQLANARVAQDEARQYAALSSARQETLKKLLG